MQSSLLLPFIPLLLLPSYIISQPPTAPVPGLLHFPSLPPYQGTIYRTLVDSSFNIYAAGTTTNSSFISKRTPSLDPLWFQTLPSLPTIPPTIAFSDQGALFAIAPRHAPRTDTNATSDEDASNFADVVLYQLDTVTGSVLRIAQVETVRWLPHSKIRCILTSAAEDATLVYITYVVQDGVQPSRARTRVVQMVSSVSGDIARGWSRVLTPTLQSSSSAAITRDLSKERVVVAEVSASDVGKAADQLRLYSVDDGGTAMQSASMPIGSTNASIDAFGMDDRGGYYVGEGPGLFHKVAWKELEGQQFLVRLWNVSDIQVVDMTVLQNGSAVYVLSDGEGFNNVGNDIVRTKTPILSVYNSTGHRLFQSTYTEPVPETERQLYSLLLIDPSRQCHAILGGFVRLAASDIAEKQISIGLFTFPKLFRVVKGEQNNSQGTAPNGPDSPTVDDRQPNTVLVVVAVGMGVVVFLAIVVVALFTFYHGRGAENELKADESNKTISTVQDHDVLV